jgi:hypothetical protein
VADGHPPEVLSQHDVVPDLEAQDVGVEGECVVEVGDPDADEGDVRVGRTLRRCSGGFSSDPRSTSPHMNT